MRQFISPKRVEQPQPPARPGEPAARLLSRHAVRDSDEINHAMVVIQQREHAGVIDERSELAPLIRRKPGRRASANADAATRADKFYG